MLQNSYLVPKQIIKSKYLDDYVLDLHMQNFIYPDLFYYKIIVVTKDQIARPDIISKDVYGDDQYGDLICKINDISNPFELNEGCQLVVPSAEYIDGFYTNDPYFEDDPSTTAKPVAKKKNEKRKPNEALISDTRFKIDPSNRVIVY